MKLLILLLCISCFATTSVVAQLVQDTVVEATKHLRGDRAESKHLARHLGTENHFIYNDKNSGDNGQNQIESNTFSGDTFDYLLVISSEEETMPETKPMSIEMFTNIKPADHLVEHEALLTTPTMTMPSDLSNVESTTIPSTTAVSYTSKYESTLDSIEYWCLHDDDDGNTINCQCDNPLVPTSKTSSQNWYKSHEQNIDLLQQTGQQLKDQQLDVIFIGDSITEQRRGTILGQPYNEYNAIKEEFDMSFTKDKGGDYNGIALGISGDTTTNLLWRLLNGEMPLQQNLTPKAWWISIGINDLLKNNCSEDIVVLGIKRIVEEIQNAQPNATIVINSILPIQTDGSGILEQYGEEGEEANDSISKCNRRMCYEWWPHIDTINKRLREFAYKNKGVNFFNADDIFIQEKQEGKYLNLDLMDDPVHPNVLGHRRWNGSIKKRLAYLIG